MDRLDRLRMEMRMPDASDTHATNRVDGLIGLCRRLRPTNVLEIGCARGVSTEVFCLLAENVVAVDPWEPPFDCYYDEFVARCGGYDNLVVIRGASPAALARFAPGTFDLVYIDGDHSDEGIAADLVATVPLVRPGGVLAGHDFNMQPVARAVIALCKARAVPWVLLEDWSWTVRL
ncbi:MAG TPA: class I SAM-dependent methyltransferase [Candidatus Acidoferrum sp.]